MAKAQSIGAPSSNNWFADDPSISNAIKEEIRPREGSAEVYKRYNFYDGGYTYGIQHMGKNLEIFVAKDN